MRKSASEIINDLETRVANLEKEAIFGLFKPKTLKEQNEARLRKEQKQEAALNKLKAKALKARTKVISKVNEKFLKGVQYEIHKSPSVDNVDVSLNRGRMVGVISVGGFEYKIESSLGKVSFMMPDEYVMRKDLNDFRVTEGKFIISGLGLRSDAVITYNISDYADNASYVATDIIRVLVKASNVAHSDKAVSDRAERKRMRKEKYRLAGRTEKSAGRRYDDDEWVFFIHEGTGLEDDREGKRTAERLRNKFEDCIYDICEKYGLSICDEYGLSHVAFKAYASLVGHGTGLWDLPHSEADMLEGIVESDPKCGPLSQAIENLPYDLGLA